MSALVLETCQAESALQGDNRRFFFIGGLLQGVMSFRYFRGLEEELRVNTAVGLEGSAAGALLLLVQGGKSLGKGWLCSLPPPGLCCKPRKS